MKDMALDIAFKGWIKFPLGETRKDGQLMKSLVLARDVFTW